ncbi:MAG: UDP-glucose 6-dehydrogenase, partial [Paramuribaculum sp.]|nr:UDP-glucose 6-dehydrogenase [Paramuribaculum sp.]
IEEGAEVSVFDPVAMNECKRRLGDKVRYAKDMYDAAVDADAIALVTEWKVFRIPAWNALKKVMRGNVIVDGRNIYNPAEVTAEGFNYLSIGRQ